MYEDDVIKEVRKVKDAIGRRYGYDIAKMAEAFRKHQINRLKKSTFKRSTHKGRGSSRSTAA